MITVTGQPTFDDYLRVQRFHGRSRTLFVTAILVVMALFVWLTSHNVVLPACVAIYVFVLRPLYIRFRIKRHWQQTPSAHRGEKTYGMDEIGFHSEDDNGNAVVTHWDKFLKSRESTDSFLLYLSPHMYLFLPKRFMSPEDQEATRKILKERIGPTVRGDA